MLTPQQIEGLLAPLPICYDIQYKILMMSIGLNGTPSSKVARKLCDQVILHRSRPRFNYFTYKENTLTSFCIELSLFNYMKHVYEEEAGDGGDVYDIPDDYLFNEFVYDLCIAYEHYRKDDNSPEFFARRGEDLAKVVKRRLQKMIEGEPTVQGETTVQKMIEGETKCIVKTV